MTELSTDDVLSLQRLVAEYAHIMDARDFPNLSRIFAADATFDATAFGAACCRGVNEITAMMVAEARHPVAHHTTDCLVSADGPGRARLRTKGLAVSERGTVTSLIYADEALLTSDGWRILTRTARPL